MCSSKKRLHLAGADFLLALPADARQFVAELLALGIGAVIGPVEFVLAGEHARLPAWRARKRVPSSLVQL